MKVAILVWDLHITGGTQRQALELASNLGKQGHEVDVYCYTYDKDRTYGELCDTLTIHAVKSGKDVPLGTRRESRKNKMPLWLWNILKGLNLYLVLIKREFGENHQVRELKDLIEKHHPINYYDIINPQDYGVHEISQIISHPHIVWSVNDVHRTPIKSKFFLHTAFFNFLTRLFAPRDVKNISRILVVDSKNKKIVQDIYHREADIVHGAVGVEMFEGKTVPPHTEGEPWRIFATSIFFPYRRFEDIVDAIDILVKKGIKNISAVINGRPERAYAYFEFVRNRVIEKGLSPYITIKTGMPENDLKAHYLASDIFIFPNVNQTWGLAVFEGMLAGCATIVSRGAGAHEILTDRVNALLVDPCKPEQIAEAIERIMTNPKEAREMQEEGTRFVRQNLTWDVYAREMAEVFAQELKVV